MDALITQETALFATLIEAIAGLIVIGAALVATWLALGMGRTPPDVPRAVAARLLLGRWLALALEFELAADILRTAATPSWNEIGQLAAIIVIRTVLNFFLERDVARAGRRQSPA